MSNYGLIREACCIRIKEDERSDCWALKFSTEYTEVKTKFGILFQAQFYVKGF